MILSTPITIYNTTEANSIGSMVYEKTSTGKDTLSFVLQEEGMVLGKGTYQYNLKDHLGNTRVMFSKSAGAGQTASLLQSTDYYPFVKSFENNNVSKNRYLYNGKEQQDQVIGGMAFGWYDYGARFYDPEVPHFTSIDPLAEKHYNESTYIYCGNNPINRIDPNGMDWYQDNKGNTFWQDGDAKTVTRNDITYSNIGANYSYSIGNTTYSFEQSKMTTITVSVLDKDQFQTQFDSRFGNEKQQRISCKKADEVMLANADVTSASRNDATQQVGKETSAGIVPTKNLKRGDQVLKEEVELNGNPVIVGVDRGIYGRGMNDGTTDHWITISGYTYDLKNNTTAYNYFDPGNKTAERGTSPINILTRGSNGLLRNTNARRTYTVTNVRPNKKR